MTKLYSNNIKNYFRAALVGLSVNHTCSPLLAEGAFSYLINLGLSKPRFYSSSGKTKNIVSSLIEKKVDYVDNGDSTPNENTYNYFQYGKTKTEYNNFKFNSPIYQSLSLMLKDKPLNDETQIEIERLLLNYSYIALTSDNKSNNNFSVDYSMINSELSKLLLKEQDSLSKLITNFKQELSHNKTNNEYVSYLNTNIESIAYADVNQILHSISNKYLINVMLGRLLKILSYYQQSKNDFNSVVEVGCDLGKDIINHYCYQSYLIKKSQVDNKSEYYLSTWKAENSEFISKCEDSTFQFELGSILIGWMLTCNLLYKKVVDEEKDKKINILLPSKILVDNCKEKIVLALPKKIPMLVPPKPYSDKRLGGFLLNDEKVEIPLIRKKWLNKYSSKILENNSIYYSVNKVSSVGYKINTDVLDFILYNQGYFKNKMTLSKSYYVLKMPNSGQLLKLTLPSLSIIAKDGWTNHSGMVIRCKIVSYKKLEGMQAEK
jgi:hypothetical protein